jgi:uncharacterized membrane protein (DUF2068 family)
LSHMSQTLLCVVSNNLHELKLCNSSMQILELQGAILLVQLLNLDRDYFVLKVDHLHLQSLTVFDVMINYTAFPKHSQVTILQSLLNCFPFLQILSIKVLINMQTKLYSAHRCCCKLLRTNSYVFI